MSTEPAPTDQRRYKRIRMSEAEHNRWFAWQFDDRRKGIIPGLPEDVQFVDQEFDHARQAWDVTFWSASWPMVEIDDEVPRIIRSWGMSDLMPNGLEPTATDRDIASRENPITA